MVNVGSKRCRSRISQLGSQYPMQCLTFSPKHSGCSANAERLPPFIHGADAFMERYSVHAPAFHERLTALLTFILKFHPSQAAGGPVRLRGAQTPPSALSALP
jgi:hypothetical protein